MLWLFWFARSWNSSARCATRITSSTCGYLVRPQCHTFLNWQNRRWVSYLSYLSYERSGATLCEEGLLWYADMRRYFGMSNCLFWHIVFRTGRHGATLPAGAFAGAAEASGAELRVLAFHWDISQGEAKTKNHCAIVCHWHAASQQSISETSFHMLR